MKFADLPERDLAPITEHDLPELTQVFKMAREAWPGAHVGLAFASVYCPDDPAVFITPAGAESDDEHTYFLTGGKWVSFVTHNMSGGSTTEVMCWEQAEGEEEPRLVAKFEPRKV